MQKVHEKHNKKATRKKNQKTSNPLKSLEWLTWTLLDRVSKALSQFYLLSFTIVCYQNKPWRACKFASAQYIKVLEQRQALNAQFIMK